MTRLAHDVELDLWFYNLDNGRPRKVVNGEVGAILTTWPAALAGVEAVGMDFDDFDGYREVRDRSTTSRANVAAWIREDYWAGVEQWDDLRTSWPRTEYDGRHEPRSFLRTQVGRVPLWVAHQPPKGLEGRLTLQGQQEGVDVLADAMTPPRRPWPQKQPRVVLWDPNRFPGETGPGPDELAKRINGQVVGRRLDGAVIRGAGQPSDVEYPEVVCGVQLRSDHGHAFRFTLTVPARWATVPKEHR